MAGWGCAVTTLSKVDKNKYGISIQELFSFLGKDFKKRLFAVFVGHIDDSGSKESNLFTLSCLIAWGGQWW
jgi:hypothetical protein